MYINGLDLQIMLLFCFQVSNHIIEKKTVLELQAILVIKHGSCWCPYKLGLVLELDCVCCCGCVCPVLRCAALLQRHLNLENCVENCVEFLVEWRSAWNSTTMS